MDLALRNGLIVDGSGAPGRVGDVGIADGRIALMGDEVPSAAREIDVTGQVVAPGFVDVHTHFDAQVFWDGTLSPSPLHGVTTVVSGNCGFTLAPTSDEDSDYLARMLSRVEGMPFEVVSAAVPFSWSSTAEYLDAIEGTLMPNAGFLVGHSALRRVVMHDAATERTATDEEIAQMCELLRAGLTAGGLGFSSTWSQSHSDHRGVPVPSRWADKRELVALCGVTGEFDGTSLEFIPGTMPFDPEVVELMADMSAAAQRPLNWNVLVVYDETLPQIPDLLAVSDLAAERGGRVVALTAPDAIRARLSFLSCFILDMLPDWQRFVAQPVEQRLADLRDPVRRAELGESASRCESPARIAANWGGYRLETHSAETARYDGWTVDEIAADRGITAWDALCDVVVADELKTTLILPALGTDEGSWAAKSALWTDPRVVVGASDAGAHLDMLDTFSYTTVVLGEGVRERGLVSLEQAVHLLTGRPAGLYGLRDRGILAQGAHADVVVFDPDRIGPGRTRTEFDLPGGAGRLYGEPNGISHVVVNGVPVVEKGEFRDARPGRVIRSGRDTATSLQSMEIG
ncbi:MAG: amidohydrolase family protein [Acidimicrobiales bacterium]